jgi:Ca2+-binding RTX toxin-like protein
MGTYTGDDGPNVISGGSRNDKIYGYGGGDILYGNEGNDTLYGGTGSDKLYGGDDVDKLYGGSGADGFYFDTIDSGDVVDNEADIIQDFQNQDTIWLKGEYTYEDNTSVPSDDHYSIWQNGSDWVVTWKATDDDEWHDVTVKGDDPHGDIDFFFA